MRGFLFLTTLLVSTAAMPAPMEAASPAAVSGSFQSVETERIKIDDETHSPDSEGFSDKLDSTVVVATRAGRNTPVTYTMVGREALVRTNPINSLPMALALQPSVIATNEGGTGLGYSKMTVRGSKGSQINVTLNGITLNDSESQEVFWVNIPALSSLLSSVQLQRGLGTSANGAGAFGASVNMSTASVSPRPYVNAEFGYGSYDTFTSCVSAGTGLTKSGIHFSAAYSKNLTDGYIRNAKANVQSAMATLGWMNANNSLKLTWLMGNQCTGITWNGISLSDYASNRCYNSAGEYYDYSYDSEGNQIVNSVHYYDNETDNYTQHHVQLNYTHQFGNSLIWSTTANLTKGDGWYDQYKAGKKFKKYAMQEYAPAGVSKSDFIINKCMDNLYLVLKSDLGWKSDLAEVTGGLSYSRYNGGHFGKVLWSSVLGDNWTAADGTDYDKFNADRMWYDNSALKQEGNAYLKGEYTPLEWLTAYADLQLRGVWLRMSGVGDEDKTDMSYSNNWLFFNPRAGLTFHKGGHRAYVSAALGHREPGRPDIKENIEAGIDKSKSVRPEEMVDVEIGYEWSAPKVTAAANLYFMEYWDMLLETGRLSDTGYPVKDNVSRAYRRGIELSAAYSPLKWFSVAGNLTLSLNRVLDYSETFSVLDDNWEQIYDPEEKPLQEEVHFGKTTMLMSPSVVSMLQLQFRPFATVFSNSLKTTTLTIDGKYVGKQYVDNTKSSDRMIPGYFVSNLSLTHEFNLSSAGAGSSRLRLGFYINNLFNNLYYVDGTCWSKGIIQSSGKTVSMIGIYPQAPISFMGKVVYAF